MYEEYLKDYSKMTDEELILEYEAEMFDSLVLYHREDAEIGTYIIRDGEIVFLYELIGEEMARRGFFDIKYDDKSREERVAEMRKIVIGSTLAVVFFPIYASAYIIIRALRLDKEKEMPTFKEWFTI